MKGIAVAIISASVKICTRSMSGMPTVKDSCDRNFLLPDDCNFIGFLDV